MSEQKVDEGLLIDHEYDGIQELDNDLPRWWLYGFYLTILFAGVYLVYYHLAGMGSSTEQEFLREMAGAGYQVPKTAVEEIMSAAQSQLLVLFLVLCALLFFVVGVLARTEKQWLQQLEAGTCTAPSAAEKQRTISRQIQEKLIIDHEYDGIQELDNDLPRWWLYGFYFTIVFALAYLVYYHLWGAGPSMEQEFLREMTEAGYQTASPP